MIQIIYASAATAPYSRKDLMELLRVARLKNSALDLSGMLLYHGGSFLQVLEGPQKSVDAVFGKIEKDPRHNKLLVLLRREIQGKEFENWSMGFVDTTRLAENVEGFVDYVTYLKNMTLDKTRAYQMLKRFQEGAWRRAEHGACF